MKRLLVALVVALLLVGGCVSPTAGDAPKRFQVVHYQGDGMRGIDRVVVFEDTWTGTCWIATYFGAGYGGGGGPAQAPKEVCEVKQP